jgi:ribonuclease J
MYFIPVHGEYKHLKCHKKLAVDMGIPKENILIAEIGNVIETDGVDMQIVSQVPAGRVLVDGLGVGDIGSIVLRDRKHLSEDGLIIVSIVMERGTKHIVSGPDIISRGFVYVRESGPLIDEARHVVYNTIRKASYHELNEWNFLKTKVRDALSDYIYAKTKRNPMILPILNEI